MLICSVCGEVFEYASTGEVGLAECPFCHSEEVHEATECKICREYFLDEYNTEVCESCLEQEYTVETAIEYGKDRTETVEVNGAFYALLSEEEINAILCKYVEEHFTDHSKEIEQFLEEDKLDFATWLTERRG